ncbi:MAG: EF-hand domain-containing protein [Polaromonas sp.]
MTVFATLTSTPANAPHSRQKHSATDFIPGFEMRSVLLVAALALVTAATHAQTSPSSGANPASPPSQISPQVPGGNAGSIPPNKPNSKDIDAAFDKADANHDGRLDRKEAEKFPPVAQRFDLLDANRDGFVSRDELAKVAGS